ncbi:MAG: GNAT family N-acetyltransferase [Planctomycetota bacterium]|jgi:RimJ/RimL family protein N-acetyltransferase
MSAAVPAWGDRLPTVPGPRLDLRWIEEHEVDGLFAVFSDPEVVRYWSTPAMRERREAEEYLASIHRHFAAGDLFQWGVQLHGETDIVGTTTLYRIDLDHRRAEVGIALGSRAWGKGFGREVLRLLIGFAFDELGLHRLEADVDPGNARSLALFEGEGFRREGLLRERWHLKGKVHDTVMLGLLAREWPGAPKA